MPTVTRTVEHGPSREELFDALRLSSEQRPLRVVVASEIVQVGASSALTRGEVASLMLRSNTEFELRFDTGDGITVIDAAEDRWLVTAHLQLQELAVACELNYRPAQPQGGKLTLRWDDA